MKSFIDYFNELEIDETDPKYLLISNFSKFQVAKNTGLIKPEFLEYLSFLKYEYNTKARADVMHRLFTLALGPYNQMVAEELFNARVDN